MAAFYTHYKFGKDILKETKIKNIDTNLYNIFNQSFDNFYFYNFYMPFYDSKVNEIAKIGHRKNVNDYFINIIDYMKTNNQINNPQLRSYLYGSINHYVLDSTLHPYIFYMTGVFNKDNVSTYKYNGLHTDFEFSLDAYLYKKEFSKPYYKEKITKNIFKKPNFNLELSNCIDDVFTKTYNIKGASKLYIKSIKSYRFIYKWFYTDRFGIKKRLLKILDIITGKKNINLHSHTTHYKTFNNDYLNEKNNIWNHPTNKKDKYKKSLMDLYDDATEKSINIIIEIEKYFNNETKLDNIKTIIGNNSYVTGLDINKNKKMKYFKI